MFLKLPSRKATGCESKCRKDQVDVVITIFVKLSDSEFFISSLYPDVTLSLHIVHICVRDQ